METLNLKELTFLIRRSNKRKTVGIAIEKDGALIIHAPVDTSLAKLEEIVYSRRLWVYKHLLNKEVLNINTKPIKEYKTGEGFYYLGKSYRLQVLKDNSQKTELSLKQGRFYLNQKDIDKGRDYFIAWYKSHLLAYLIKLEALYVDRIGAKANSIVIRELGNRWGSCNLEGVIYFHWRVAMLPKSIIEYILIHELVHLLEPNHNNNFWNYLDRVMPDYLIRKQWLAENGVLYDL